MKKNTNNGAASHLSLASQSLNLFLVFFTQGGKWIFLIRASSPVTGE